MKHSNQEIIIENTSAYQHLEADVPVQSIAYGHDREAACGTCPNLGKNLSCPPFSPSFPDYIKDARRAQVICVRLPAACFVQHPAEMRSRVGFTEAGKILRRELLHFRGQGRLVAGSGECRVCDPCAAAQGGLHCHHPDEQMYSLESLGVDVADLVRHCFNLELEWDRQDRRAQFISAVGAVFI